MTGPTPSESIAATPLAGRLPTMAPGDAALSRLAHDARFAEWLRATLGHAAIDVARQRAPMPWRITVDTAHGRFSLRLDAATSPALQLAFAHQPRDTACAIVTLLLAGWADAFAPALGPLRVVDIAAIDGSPGVNRANLDERAERADHNDGGEGRADTFRPVVLGGSTPIVLDDAEPALLDRLAAVIASSGIDLSPLAALPLRPSIRLFSRSFPRGVLRALQPGDVVLAGDLPPLLRCGVGRALRARLHIDPQEFIVHLAEPPFLSDDPALAGTADASHDPASGAGADAPLASAGSLDELQLPVAFELDTARIALADLASMQPGYAVELDVPLREAAVRLVCHGRLLGQGQLIAIGDQLGVRITRLEFAHDAAAAR